MFAKRIKELRKSRQLNQTEMGEKLNLSQKQISHLEIGRNEPDINTIKQYCTYFNISADYLIGLIDETKPLK